MLLLNIALFLAAASTPSVFAKTAINYSTVTGYFLQDDPNTNVTGFDYTAVNFGLINQTYPGITSTGLTQWQQFERLVNDLNANAPLETVYKVFWFGRHGEGFHNAAESYYGTPAWNCYWSELDGNGTAVWADADLTINGINQALIANAYWKSRISTQKIPYPQSYYTSPLTRCLRTANFTFSDISLPRYYSFVPTVKEFFREGISVHTCDRRGTKTYIHGRFPDYKFEHGFTEQDELWNANYAETSSAQDTRSKAVLDSVFTGDDHTWISVTSHSGEIASLLRVLGHRSFSLSTGAIIPVLVKADFTQGEKISSSSTAPARTSSRYCTNAPPITSISTGTQGCVCTADGSAGGGSSTRAPGASATGSANGSSKATGVGTSSGSATKCTESVASVTKSVSGGTGVSSRSSPSRNSSSSSMTANSIGHSTSKKACKAKQTSSIRP